MLVFVNDNFMRYCSCHGSEGQLGIAGPSQSQAVLVQIHE